MRKKPSLFRRMFKKRKAQRRGFNAAKVSRLLNDWVLTSQSLDKDIKSGLTALRARSRDLCMNNDYGRRFMSLLAVNVVGPDGIRLQNKAKKAGATGNATTDLDRAANVKIESAWASWARKQNCSANRKHSLIDLERLIVQSLARDGEFLLRKVRGFDNPFGFALQIIEPDYLDHNYSDEKLDIHMGIERNEWKEPIAYHILKKLPENDSAWPVAGQARARIPADQIIHGFISERGDQSRGYPWTATALKRLHMLGHYEESELIASRVGAAKMGFFVSQEGGNYMYDDKDESGNLINEVAPGKFEQLPAGWDFKKFDIDHPSTGFDDFVKQVLKGAASGLNVSYISLANDPSAANFSSMRHGALEDRDFWKMLQGWIIEHVLQDVFDDWLPLAIASGQIRLPLTGKDRFNAPVWHGRRWSWIDPQKDMAANEKAVSLGVNSRTRIAYESGNDIDDIFDELKQENEVMKGAGLIPEPEKQPIQGKGANDERKNDKNRDPAANLKLLQG